MAERTYKRLTVARVGALAKVPGMHPDGDGLYLNVTKTGATSWIYRYMRGRREHSMGLGPLRHVGLAEARRLADEARQLRRAGIDPLTARRSRRQDAAFAAAKTMSFRECAVAYIAAHRAGWRSARHAQQWAHSLEEYAYPLIADVSVQAVDVGLVMRVLEPIWVAKPETASRVRGRTEAVLDWASARGFRSGDNPARWRGHLENLLPKRDKVAAVRHHAALPYGEIGAFMAELRQQQGTAARVLEFLILTAGRTGEVVGARWDEIEGKVWTVPAERTKSRREHRVPLSDAALAVLKQMRDARTSELVFPSAREGALIKSMSLSNLLHRMNHREVTVHGFRSAFRSWAADRRVQHEVAEQALGHAVSAAVVRAYQRSDLFELRRELMTVWARFCDQPDAGTVVPIGIAR